MNREDTILLNDCSRIPMLGFGCFEIEDTVMDDVVRWAVDAGYRYFDAATRYENEESVGRAVRRCGVSRDELYIVSKIWPSCYDEPERAIEYSLRALNLGYIDSYYLHWPSSSPARRYRAWEALLRYREKGLIRSVGVSNFTQTQLEALTAEFGVVPIANQIELHPWYQQTNLCDWCHSRKIAVTAWGPIFRGHIREVPLMAELGEKYAKSPAQITLRWHLQRGHIVIPKSSRRERIIENAELYDFSLTQEDMNLINALECGRHFGSDPNTNDGENFKITFKENIK